MVKPGFAFACKERELEWGLPEEQAGSAALLARDGAKGDDGEQSVTVKRPDETVPGVGAVGGQAGHRVSQYQQWLRR